MSLLVSLALWLAALRQIRQVRRLLGGSAVESGRAAEILAEVRGRFDLAGGARLILVDAPITPMLWAAPGNSAIVLPRQLADSLSDDRLRCIIAHELGHFVRRDHWANSLAFRSPPCSGGTRSPGSPAASWPRPPKLPAIRWRWSG